MTITQYFLHCFCSDTTQMQLQCSCTVTLELLCGSNSIATVYFHSAVTVQWGNVLWVIRILVCLALVTIRCTTFWIVCPLGMTDAVKVVKELSERFTRDRTHVPLTSIVQNFDVADRMQAGHRILWTCQKDSYVLSATSKFCIMGHVLLTFVCLSDDSCMTSTAFIAPKEDTQSKTRSCTSGCD